MKLRTQPLTELQTTMTVLGRTGLLEGRIIRKAEKRLIIFPLEQGDASSATTTDSLLFTAQERELL